MAVSVRCKTSLVCTCDHDESSFVFFIFFFFFKYGFFALSIDISLASPGLVSPPGYVSIISGPAGGVIGFSHTQTVFQESSERRIPFVGFDMGGTSTDVARVEGAWAFLY
jgi:hypothetical protein